jgi:hypothetical protein
MSIDAEWGLAMRVENTPQYPYAITLALPESKRLGLSSRKTNRSRSKISIDI